MGNRTTTSRDVAVQPPPTTEAMLAELDARAHQDAWRDRADGTNRAYLSDIAMWHDFCRASEISPELISAGLLRLFVEWMDRTHALAPSTMKRRVYGVVTTLRDLHGIYAVPKGIGHLAESRIAAIERDLVLKGEKRGRGPAGKITPDELRSLLSSQQQDTPLGLRNRTLMLLAAMLGTRISENVGIRGDDITGDREFLVVRIRWSKTGPKEPVLSAKPGSDLCPVTAWWRWKEVGGIGSGPIYPRMDRHGNIYRDQPITTRAAEKVIHNAAQKAGLSQRVRVTGHSFRAFMATESYYGGSSIPEIAAQGGWHPSSRALWGYIRAGEARDRNPTMFID